MKTLKDAREKKKLEDFIKEHQADPKGDLDKLDEVIRHSAKETAKATRQESAQNGDDD